MIWLRTVMICHTVKIPGFGALFWQGFSPSVLPSVGALVGSIHVLPEKYSEATELHLR